MSTFLELLSLFAPCFTSPAWEYFKYFILAYIMGNGPRTVTMVYLFAGIKRSFSCFHKFMRVGLWREEKLRRIFINLLVAVTRVKEIIVAIDDTYCQKTGKKIFGVNPHYDHHAKRTSLRYLLGLNWVVAGLLVPVNSKRRWVLFPPVGTALYS